MRKAFWEVKFEHKLTPMLVRADTFLEAVEEARKISDKILHITYIGG
jgi:hypothetical protein